jgi:hypothetical protein
VNRRLLSLSPTLFLFLACSNGQRHSTDPALKSETHQPNAREFVSAGAAAVDRDSNASLSARANTRSSVSTPTPTPAQSTDSGAADPNVGGNSASAPHVTANAAGVPSTNAASVKPEAATDLASNPALYDASGAPLPQTRDLPAFDSPAFKRRMELLFQAIVDDNPKLAEPVFFPVVAYEQVKDVAQPARDWKFRLMAAFAKNIHEYHQKLGRDRAQARFSGIDAPNQSPRWMTPGSEGNRLGYHRALRSQLRFIDAQGKERRLEITSMISWRGEWYVVHLNGFK